MDGVGEARHGRVRVFENSFLRGGILLVLSCGDEVRAEEREEADRRGEQRAAERNMYSQPRGSRRSEGTQNTPWEPLEGDAREDATLPLHLLAIAVL